MHNQDEILQNKLHALESGQPLEQSLANLPEGPDDLEPLLRLATALRNLSHPNPTSEQAGASRRKVLQAVEQDSAQPSRRWRLPWGGPQAGKRFVPALGISLAVLLVAGLMLLSLGIWLRGARVAQAATLVDVSGQVEVARSGLPTSWQAAHNGDRLQTGDRLRTGAGSYAALAFFDGSRTTLSPQADLTLTQVDGGRGNVLRVALTLNAGKSDHSVVPLRGANSSFSVLTPSGVASVHGTTFRVAVDPDGDARFAVQTGKVLVSNDADEVFLQPGQATLSEDDQVLEAPAYEFSLQGELSIEGPRSWSVSGVSFSLLDNTVVIGEPQVGDRVSVEGRVVGGVWIADRIEPIEENEQISAFTGVIETMNGQVWTISGQTVSVDGAALGANLAIGVPVRVQFRVLEDGSLLAIKIEPLQEASPAATETPVPAPDPLAQPDLSFDPDDLQFELCRADDLAAPGYIGTLRNGGVEADDRAVEVALSAQVVAGADWVDWVELTPDKFASIEAGQAVNFGIRPVLKGTWDAAPDGSEVKVRVFVVHEVNRPDNLHTRLTVTLVKRCSQGTPMPTDTVSATPGITVTATVTATPAITATPVVTPTLNPIAIETTCTGATPHPEGTRLAQRWGVPYEEIMGWFCQGFGFGEINLAYELSQKSGLPAASVFEMRRSGLGWGVIKQQLDPKPAKSRGKPGIEVTPAPADAIVEPGMSEPGKSGDNPGNSNGHKGPFPTKTPKPKRK